MRAHRERGAAAVEYALIIGLLVIGLLAAISRFEDNADARYDERGTQGDPAESFGNLGPSDGGSSGGTDGSTPPGGAVVAVVIAPLTAAAPASGNDWSMTVTVQVTGDGNPLGGVTFTAPTWSPSLGGTGSCTTTSTGICTFTQSPMDRTGSSPVGPVAFTIGTPSFTNPDGTSPTFSGPGATTITCQRPTTGGGSGTCA